MPDIIGQKVRTGAEIRAAKARAQWPWRQVAEVSETAVRLVCGHSVPSHLLDNFRQESQGRAIHELLCSCRRCYREGRNA